MNKDSKYTFLFILDAVRKDHLGVYGYKRKTSDNIDTLAKNSEVFNWAISPSSYTHAAIPSILTGKYPFDINNPFYSWKLSEDDLKQLKTLKELGYSLSLFTGHISTSKKTINFASYFDHIHNELTSSETNRKEMLIGFSKNIIDKLIKYIKTNKNKKNLVIIHLMEAHGPYDQNYNSIFLNDEMYKKDKRKVKRIVFDDFREVTDDTLKDPVIPRYQLYEPIYDGDGNIEDFNPNVNNYVAHYDMGIYTQDQNIGRFIKFLKENGLYDSSTITITSDHGELMGEDNIYFSHGIYTHPALINVPLIIKRPNQKKGIAKDENFSNQYLLNNLIKELPTRVEGTYLNENSLLSFTAQSFSILHKDYLIMIHNGNYHFSGALKNVFFAIWTFKDDDIIKNYSELDIIPHIKIFKKTGGTFKEVSILPKKIFIYTTQKLLNILKIVGNNIINYEVSLYKKISDQSISLEHQIKLLNTENTKIKQLITKFKRKITHEKEVIKKLKNEINDLKTQLSKIYTSKTWKLLNIYKKTLSLFKKK